MTQPAIAARKRLAQSLTAYRVGDPDGPFPIYSDEGSSEKPGRWNTGDSPLVYASDHYSAAMLEVLCHAEGKLPPNQHFVEIHLPEGLSCESLNGEQLPGWDSEPPTVSQDFGRRWVKERRSAILLVPCHLARMERNVLINLHHPEAKRITVSKPRPVWWSEK